MRSRNLSSLRINANNPEKLSLFDRNFLSFAARGREHRTINLYTRFARARKNAEKRDDVLHITRVNENFAEIRQ